MRIPVESYRRIKERLWNVADERDWPTLSDQQKTALYEDWARDDVVGGVLSRYMDPGNVRVYIKDTIMKPYGRERIKYFEPVLRLLGLPGSTAVAEAYIKPHGRRLEDGRVVCWGLAREWKAIFFAIFERAYLVASGVPYAAVLMYPNAKFQQPGPRGMIETAAQRLEIEHLIWYDG